MIELHPEFLEKDGKREFAVLPYDEFVAIQDLLEDAADLLELRKAKQEEGNIAGVGLDELRVRFGLDD